ncbi:hypothetical protein OIU79_010994 [Salix purpurea]|uniref:Uncharacterized protein n=1 Tax=Salix purpurea TaxID=77065 RepID=A0A9Q0T9Z6_SALPP|nr:hypothetical protein OIU79_010994 [Salix purpurea]
MADDGEKREIVVGLPNNHDKLFKIRKPPKPKPKAAEGEEMNVKKRKAAEGEEMNVKKKRRRRRILKEKVDEGEKGNDDLPEEGEQLSRPWSNSHCFVSQSGAQMAAPKPTKTHPPKQPQNSPPPKQPQTPSSETTTKAISWADRVKVTDSTTRYTLDHIPQRDRDCQLEITDDMLTEHAEQWSRCMVGFFPGYRMNYHAVNKIASRVWRSHGLEDDPLNIEVEFEWKPTRCAKCCLFGHSCSRGGDGKAIDEVPSGGVVQVTAAELGTLDGKPSHVKVQGGAAT